MLATHKFLLLRIFIIIAPDKAIGEPCLRHSQNPSIFVQIPNLSPSRSAFCALSSTCSRIFTSALDSTEPRRYHCGHGERQHNLLMGHVQFGSKGASGLYQAIIALMPAHDVYLETHLGRGQIMKRKPAAQRNIGIDLDAEAILGFSCDYPVELVHGCCHEYLQHFACDANLLVYADPPYLKSTRKAPQRYRYRYDYEADDHVQLLGILKQLPCQVMISGYPNALYDEMLENWRTMSVQVMNQAGVVTEKVWFNFTPGNPHWARYAGKNAVERQRIKRKAQSWGQRYRAMAPGERLAVMAQIMAVQSELGAGD